MTWLLKHGSNIHMVDREGRSPLLLAMKASGRWKEATALVVAGADLNSSNDDAFDSTVKLAVLCRQEVELWKTLAQRGVNLNTRVRGHAVLHRAAERKKTDIIDALIEVGADIEFQS